MSDIPRIATAAQPHQLSLVNITTTATTTNMSLVEVFQTIESRLASTSLGPDRWYLLVIASVVASPDPELSSELYKHLISQPAFQTSASRQQLIRRIREALLKCTCLVGVAKPIEAILSIAKEERPEDRDYTLTREGWQADEANHERGVAWLKKIYAQNTTDTVGLFDAHKDFAWISTEISYGLILSDRQVLDDVDTEIVVLAALMSQNLPTETRWHIRGSRRIGISKDDVQVLWECVHVVAKHFGMPMGKLPTVDDVEPEV